MKKLFAYVAMTIFCAVQAMAQSPMVQTQGVFQNLVAWNFDGITLTISNTNKKVGTLPMPEFDTKSNPAPWIKRGLNIRKVRIEAGVSSISSCAFYGCKSLTDVEFATNDVAEIGWGAFMNCSHLRNISFPVELKKIGTIAFANCVSLSSVTIPDQCRVDDQAFVSCTGLTQLNISSTCVLGHYVFATEVKTDDGVRHALCNAEIKKLPVYVNNVNCHEYGLAQTPVEKYYGEGNGIVIDYDEATSEIDKEIPVNSSTRNSTYALIIGNQNYRFVSNVPYAIHDARIFAEYCKKTLGIPVENIHITEDATKQMILEEEIEWLESIRNRGEKNVIVYYAGHGVPDVKNANKAYLLPTDVRGTSPHKGISLDDFYGKLGDLAFNQCSIFLDACFSGVNRDNEGMTEGLRGVEIAAEEGTINGGNVIVFSAAQGNETAQGYTEQGHGLFTYFLLKDIHDTNGYVTFGELADNIQRNVSRTATTLKLRKRQTPTASASDAVSDTWRSFGF